MIRAAILATGIALLLGGCGDSRLSLKDLRDRASSICLTARNQTNSIATPPSPNGEATFLKRGVAVLRPELTQLQALKPPTNVAGEYGTAMQAFEQKLSALGRAVHVLGKGEDPVTAIKALQHRLATDVSKEDGAWDSLGIPACLSR